jgi:hypothetical protein
MQTTDNFLLTAAEINEGMQILKRKVLSFLEDAEILARNNEQISHYVGLYLFALENLESCFFWKTLYRAIALTGNTLSIRAYSVRGMILQKEDKLTS